MQKRIYSLVLFIAVVLCLAPMSDAAYDKQAAVYINGERLDDEFIRIVGDSTYVSLREVTEIFGGKLTWNSEEETAYVEAPGLELTAAYDKCYIEANERYLYVKSGFIKLENDLLVPIRPFCRAFGADVTWMEASGRIYVIKGDGPIESGETFYDEEDLKWMSKIIHAEACGESLEGKIAVGNVIMNRVASDSYPDSIYGVIFDRKYGVQFTPAYSGSVYCNPSEESILAAKLALDGADVIGDGLYFVQAAISSSCWVGRNCSYLTTIGNHCFYA